MSTWKIHEMAAACGLTEYEIGGWISKGIFQPGATTRRGHYRNYDWRDLACLAVFAELRVYGLLLDTIKFIVIELHEDLSQIEEFKQKSGVFFFEAHWSRGEKYHSTVGLVDHAGLTDVLRHAPKSVIVVDVAKVYQEALARLSGLERAA